MLIRTLIKPKDEPLWIEAAAQATRKECMNRSEVKKENQRTTATDNLILFLKSG